MTEGRTHDALGKSLPLFVSQAGVGVSGVTHLPATGPPLPPPGLVETLEGFFFAVAHDLREPIRALERLSTELEETIPEAPAHRSAEARMRGCVRRLRELVDGVVRLAHPLEAVPNAPWSLKRLVHGIRGNLAPLLTSHQARLRIRGGGESLRCDPSAVREIVQNLMTNGILHNPSKEPLVECRWSRVGDVLRVEVEDNGPGIPVELRPRLFRPFQRATARPGAAGQGLGLAIVALRASQLGAHVGIRDAPGGGACFQVELPA